MQSAKPLVLSVLGAASLLLGLAVPAAADDCSFEDCRPQVQTVQTPVGPVTITADATNVVTVRFTPDEPIRLIVVPGDPQSPSDRTIPDNPGSLFRISVPTTGGVVTIATVVLRKLPGKRKPPTLTLKMESPTRCGAVVDGATVVFTPLDLVAPTA